MATLIFYDGFCGLCHGLVRFLLPRDRAGSLRFAPLQGTLAERELGARGVDPRDLDTVVLIAEWPTDRSFVLVRSRAVLHALGQLGGVWRVLAAAAAAVPRPIADAVYDAVARRRYRIFGRYDACPLPPPEWRSRFIGESSDERLT